ncbi:MAG: hypothetical protein J7527_08905 [Chitinophagaceae bacterium]|nr:hypothetical protein [Chitinophagaceae bacterium]
MSVTLRTDLGCTEAVIADDGTLSLFYQAAGILNQDLRIKFLNKEDEFDSINWDFKFKRSTLTLHYNIYNGISVFPTKTSGAGNKENDAAVELARILAGKLMKQEIAA